MSKKVNWLMVRMEPWVNADHQMIMNVITEVYDPATMKEPERHTVAQVVDIDFLESQFDYFYDRMKYSVKQLIQEHYKSEDTPDA